MMFARCHGRWSGIAAIALAVALVAAPALAADSGADEALDAELRAAFLFHFARFADWPALPFGAPIVFCVVGDDGIAAALSAMVRGKAISSHRLDVQRPEESALWRSCHLLFISDTQTLRSAGGLGQIQTLPVLTVSDGQDFCRAGGIIELYLEDMRIRFAINLDAVERSGLHLSSQLLDLAKIIRDSHVR